MDMKLNMKLNNILFKLNSEDDMLIFRHSYYILAFHIYDVLNITFMHYHNTIKYIIIMLYRVAYINETCLFGTSPQKYEAVSTVTLYLHFSHAFCCADSMFCIQIFLMACFCILSYVFF